MRAKRRCMHGKRVRRSPLKLEIEIQNKTYDDLDPEMRSVVEGMPGMPTQEDLEKHKEKNKKMI
jgi:hypothetical protein